jgi:hypothetical protein
VVGADDLGYAFVDYVRSIFTFVVILIIANGVVYKSARNRDRYHFHNRPDPLHSSRATDRLLLHAVYLGRRPFAILVDLPQRRRADEEVDRTRYDIYCLGCR